MNEARFPKVHTTVHCSICSQLNNTHGHTYVTIFDKMGHPAKKSELSFLMLFDSVVFARNYDIFVIFFIM